MAAKMGMLSFVGLLGCVVQAAASQPTCPGGNCDRQGEDEEATLLSIKRLTEGSDPQNVSCPDIPQLTSLSDPVNPMASPVCWQIRLSEQKRRMQPRVTRNTKGEKFPNQQCQKKLGSEYGYLDQREHDIEDFTAKTMAQRMLNVGAYDPVGMCPHGQLGNPNCCNWTGSDDHMDYLEFPHMCWQWPNNVGWERPLVAGARPQNALSGTKDWEGYAQYAGCKDGTNKVPGTSGQTWCKNANRYVRVGCGDLKDSNVTDCGFHPPATMYIYNTPPFASGSGDGSKPRRPQNFFSVYSAGPQVSYLNPTLPQPKDPPFGTATNPPAPVGDGKEEERGDFGWVFKQMHGKGYSCINARVKMLDVCEEKALKAKGIFTLPRKYRVGIFKKNKGGIGKQWPALLRMGGNRNHTVYDWHDVRVNGFSFKIYDAADVTGPNGEHRVNLADIPRSDYAFGAPPVTPPYGEFPWYGRAGIPDARKGFRGDLNQLQNLTTVDFLFVAIRGQYQGGCNKNNAKCLYNIFPAGGTAQCYSPMFLYGHKEGYKSEECKYPPPEQNTHATWNPLNYTYGSTSVLSLGNDSAMKMMVQPCGAEESTDGVDYWRQITNTIQDPSDPNFKANNLNHTLNKSAMQLCIFVQVQENPCTEPVEDATVKWNTKVRFVGRIYVDKAPVARYNQVCDNSAMHPYRALTAHMPIGSLNRIRQAVYAYAQQFRLYRNHGQSQSPAEQQASELPLQQPAPSNQGQTPPPIAPKCPLGF